MTKLAVKPSLKMRAGPPPPPPPPTTLPGHNRPALLRRRWVGAAAFLALLAASARLLWLSGPVQEWRFARLPLPALLRERGRQPDDPRLLYYIGLRLNGQGRFSEAESNLRMAAALDPHAPRVRDEWARALLGVGQTTAAFGQLREFAGTHPDSAPAHFLLGKFYFTNHSMKRAAEEMQRTVTLDPKNAPAWAFLSQAAAQLAMADRALEAAQRAVALAPQDAGYRLLLAALLERRNRLDAAGAQYRQAAVLAPRNAVAHQQYAAWLHSRSGASNLAMAEAEARRAVALDAASAPSWLTLGRVLRDKGQAAEAVAPLTRAATLAPDDPVPAQALAQIANLHGDKPKAAYWQREFLRRQRYVAARHDLYQKLRVNPESRELHRRMAQLLCRHGEVESCVRNYAVALRQPPDAPPTLAAVAEELTRSGFATRALPLARQAVARGPHSPDTREALGNALLQTGHLDEAIGNFNYTTTYAPERARRIQARVNRYVATHPVPLSPAQRAYRQARDLMDRQIGLQRIPPRAAELAQKAVTLDPFNADYLRLLLRIQFAQKSQAAAAIETARKLLQVAPGDSSTHALLAILLVDSAAQPEDYAQVERHLAAAAKSPDAAAQRHYGLGLLALRRGQGAQALQELKKAVALDPAADVTYYKIATAARMAGRPQEAAQALALYERRLNASRTEFNLQGDIGQHPNRPQPYLALAAFYKKNGRTGEAQAILNIARRRFSAEVLRSAAHPQKTAQNAVSQVDQIQEKGIIYGHKSKNRPRSNRRGGRRARHFDLRYLQVYARP